MMELRKTIEDTWNKRELLKSKKSIDCINTVIEEIDKGRLRIAIILLALSYVKSKLNT